MKPKNYQFADKWSREISKHGHTMIPNLLIENQSYLQLTSSEFNIVCHLLIFKWDNQHPYPSLKTIAGRLGVSTDTVRKNVRRLEQKGILRRHYRKGETNTYSFQPLIERLHILAKGQLPRQKCPPPSDNSPDALYVKMPTKEDALKKTDLKRPTRVSNGFSKIGSHLPRKYEENHE